MDATGTPGPGPAGGRSGAGSDGSRRPVRQAQPARRPDDPVLESAIRYLNRPERTEEEVKAKIEELRNYVAGDTDLKAELIAGLELFIHPMRESQASRLPAQYGSPATLGQVEAFYRELTAGAAGTGNT